MADYNNLVKVKRQSGKMSILEVTGVAEEKVRERAMEYGEVIWICQNPVRLQSYGFAPTVQAKHLIAGDILRHNYGSTSEVIGVIDQTDAFITFQVMESGRLYDKKCGKERYVPVTSETFERHISTSKEQ